MKIIDVGSICSGIEAASVAWEPLGLHFDWFSEIADFPSKVLKEKYPDTPNLGDMNDIPEKITQGDITAPDMICGGTPCQAFSLAGWKNGLNDDRGNLTLKFVDVIEANDEVRLSAGKDRTIVFWENVEGVLKDKTNAFGCLISSLAGLSDVISGKKWPNAGVLHGPKRNVAWRVLDAKFFGLPQQRKRLYVMAGGTDFFPENVLFEKHEHELAEYPSSPLVFEKEGHKFEVFREYTDCLYSAYGTKWNGNAAAYNGSLFVVQDDRIRRISPLETERLMGFPDNYTDIKGARKTNRYQATGNSWAVPVVEWIGKRLLAYNQDEYNLAQNSLGIMKRRQDIEGEGFYIDFGKDVVRINQELSLNCTPVPEVSRFSNMKSIVSVDAPKDIYISPVGCYGIVRRKQERNLNMNPRLEEVLLLISSQMTPEEIEKRSRVQKRGRFSESVEGHEDSSADDTKENSNEALAAVAIGDVNSEDTKENGDKGQSVEKVQLNIFDIEIPMETNWELLSYGFTVKDKKMYALYKGNEVFRLWISKETKLDASNENVEKVIAEKEGDVYSGIYDDLMKILMSKMA